MLKCIASDMHIGFEYAQHDKIQKFFDLASQKADLIVLCGDTFDLWRYPSEKFTKQVGQDVNETVISMENAAVDVPLIIIPGNHDYNLEKVWKSYKETYHFKISDSFYMGNVLYTHGWEFDISQRAISWAYGWLVTEFPYIYQRFFKKPSEVIKKDDSPYWLSVSTHNEARLFAYKKQLDYIVMGHTHIPMVFDHIADCGDFVDSCSYLIMDNNKTPEQKYI